MRKSFALAALGILLVLSGCSSDSGDVTSDKDRKSEGSTQSSVQRGGTAQEVGSAELSPGVSSAEADSRVGAAQGK